ncbi:MAG: hypothetical protein UIG52_07635, partial [Bacteroidales bacterium]|nr:hypothetical protein [Bacteroidales bacterium]
KIRVNTRDTWKLLCDFATLREESQTPIPNSQSSFQKIRVNTRDTWKLLCDFATLREESQTPIPNSQSKAKNSQTQFQKNSAYWYCQYQ